MPRATRGCWLGTLAVLLVVGCLLWAGKHTRQSSAPAHSAGELGLKINAAGAAYNSSDVFTVLRNLCDLYKQAFVAGDLCNSLCYYYNQWDVIDYTQSQKHVILLNFGGQKLVLKSAFADFFHFDQLPPLTNETEFGKMIRSHVNDQLGLGWQPQYQHYLYPIIWPPFARNAHLSEADKRSLWSLVQQDEYVTFAVLPLSRVVPKVLGSCGHFYSVEYVVPFKMKPQYMNLRAKILVHLMGTLKLFHEFLNEPLHWCDAKFDNFGLSADYPKRFLIMDADYLMTTSRLSRMLNKLSCRTDEDCRLLDCQARCDPATLHCGARTNDNVAVFCSKFVNVMFTSPYGYKNNRYISSCQNTNITNEDRLKDLRVVWAWSLFDV